jgi:hypothetical protein
MLPRLREIFVYSAEAAWPRAQLISLFRRSSCPLRRLELPETRPSEEELVEFIDSLPTLVELVTTDLLWRNTSTLPDGISAMLAQRNAAREQSG